MDILGIILGILAAIICLYNLFKTNDMARMKGYTPKEKKKYLIVF